MTATTATIRLSDPASLIEAVPYLIGSHAKNSLALIGFGTTTYGTSTSHRSGGGLVTRGILALFPMYGSRNRDVRQIEQATHRSRFRCGCGCGGSNPRIPLNLQVRSGRL
jgi:hypothetical protein